MLMIFACLGLEPLTQYVYNLAMFVVEQIFVLGSEHKLASSF